MDTSMKGKVMTVLGPVDPAQLGRTLTHEHLPFAGPGLFTGKVPDSLLHLSESQIQMDILWWIRQYPYLHRSNNQFGSPEVQDAVLEELSFFKKNGGGTIVDNSTPGIERIPEFLQKAALNSGVHIISGTGFYIEGSQSASRLNLSIEEMATFMKGELTEGFMGKGIKCGIIGEIGTSWPLTDFERRSLKASGEVQEELGCPVNIHPGRHPRSPDEAVRVLLEAGGKPAKTVMSHLERTIMEDEPLLEFLGCGVFCEFDLFGTEVSHYVLNPDIDMPSDAQRIVRLRHLIDNGMQDRIVIGHDIHTRHRLVETHDTFFLSFRSSDWLSSWLGTNCSQFPLPTAGDDDVDDDDDWDSNQFRIQASLEWTPDSLLWLASAIPIVFAVSLPSSFSWVKE